MLQCLANIPACVFYAIPWWVWTLLMVGVAGAGTLWAVQVFGWEKVKGWLPGILIGIGAVSVINRQRQQGYKDSEEIHEHVDKQVVDEFEQIHRKHEGETDEQLDKENKPWLKG